MNVVDGEWDWLQPLVVLAVGLAISILVVMRGT
jgi:preprotein translocase subunit Sec61beta